MCLISNKLIIKLVIMNLLGSNQRLLVFLDFQEKKSFEYEL